MPRNAAASRVRPMHELHMSQQVWRKIRKTIITLKYSGDAKRILDSQVKTLLEEGTITNTRRPQLGKFNTFILIIN